MSEKTFVKRKDYVTFNLRKFCALIMLRYDLGSLISPKIEKAIRNSTKIKSDFKEFMARLDVLLK